VRNPALAAASDKCSPQSTVQVPLNSWPEELRQDLEPELHPSSHVDSDLGRPLSACFFSIFFRSGVLREGWGDWQRVKLGEMGLRTRRSRREELGRDLWMH
jgi:hypothetical protein